MQSINQSKISLNISFRLNSISNPFPSTAQLLAIKFLTIFHIKFMNIFSTSFLAHKYYILAHCAATAPCPWHLILINKILDACAWWTRSSNWNWDQVHQPQCMPRLMPYGIHTRTHAHKYIHIYSSIYGETIFMRVVYSSSSAAVVMSRTRNA